MNKNLMAALMAGTVALAGVSSVSAFGNGEMKGGMDSEAHEAIMQAMEDGDYDAWVQAHEDAGMTGMLDEITEDEFEKMVEMHEARQSGDIETANEIAEELGIGNMRGGQGKGPDGMRGGRDGGMMLKNCDSYADWQEAMAERGLDDVVGNVTEDDFNTLKELQEQVRTLMQKFRPNTEE